MQCCATLDYAMVGLNLYVLFNMAYNWNANDTT